MIKILNYHIHQKSSTFPQNTSIILPLIAKFFIDKYSQFSHIQIILNIQEIPV